MTNPRPAAAAAGGGSLVLDPGRQAGWSDTKGWINNKGFDLALFTLSPLAGLALILGAQYLPFGRYLGPGAFYFVAIPHYLSTFTFFLDDENLAYYRTRRVAFIMGPLLCAAVVIGMVTTGYAALFLTLQFLWNIWHVSLQSTGILSLYRRLNGGPAAERGISLVAILSVNAAMTFSHLERYGPLFTTLQSIHPQLPEILEFGSLPVALVSASWLLMRVMRRPGGISLPEGAFLLTSLLLFHPYLWVGDIDLATLGMLMGHFIQYLAIVWLLHRRKYGRPSGSLRQRALSSISSNTRLLLLTLFLTGALILVADRGASALGVPWIYRIPWNVLTILHFYYDGLIWAFKQPYVRESIGPFVAPLSHIAR